MRHDEPCLPPSFRTRRFDEQLSKVSQGLLRLKELPEGYHRVVTAGDELVFETRGLHAVQAIIAALEAIAEQVAKGGAR